MKRHLNLFRNSMFLKCFVFVLCAGLFSAPIFAQNSKSLTISGVVTDSNGEPLIGASAMISGTDKGAITDSDGSYVIDGVPSNATLQFSFLGMLTQDVDVKSRTVINVSLQEDTQLLGEVLVIGYGSAKSKDLTAPIAVVKGDELSKIPAATPMSALQGKVPGVNVINNGAPGEGPIVQIRGIGSFSGSKPLYVVDGMFYDNINFLNSSDIKELSVLKDASSAAIYGVRAANGVVLITTKKGMKNQKAKITYDGYVGIQTPSNVLELCNAEEYATMLLEGNFDSYVTHFKQSIDLYGGDYSDPDFHNWKYAEDNDWYGHLLRNAVITNHSVNVSGGSNKAVYSVGASYMYQDGIMNVENNYKRANFRGSVDFDATNWLKVGFNGLFSNAQQQAPNNASWQKAFNCPPIVALYDENNEKGFPDKYGSPDALNYTSNFYNPVAHANYFDSFNETYQVLSNFYAQINFIPNKLNFRTNYSYSYQSTQGREFTPKYYVSSWQQSASTELKRSENKFYNYIWDNTLTYNDQWGKHRFGTMIGFSMRQEQWRYFEGKTTNVPEGHKEYWYIKNGDAAGATVTDDAFCNRGMSAFARVNYNYDDRYLLMLTMRADGSSKYQEKWGYFPSVGAAWVLSEEPFMENVDWLDNLKFRVSWGKLGNDQIPASDGFASIKTGNGASGVFGNTTVAGLQNTTYFSWLRWEVVDEWNAGLNFVTLGNRLNFDLDYFHRLTHNAVINPLLPFSTTTLAGNYGKILNHGFDISLSWDDRVGKDFSYNIGINMSTLQNKVLSLQDHQIIRGGKTVNIVGKEMNSFWGFKQIGIYQTPEECADDPIAVANGCEPGDFKYADLDNNGVLDANDRTTLGSYIPNLTYNINFGLNYKDFYFQLSTYGQAGAQMYNRKRALRYASQNYNFDKAQYERRWTGPGTSNTDPSAKALLKPWNVSDQKISSYFVESADFFRIQNITLGYTFRNIKMGSYTMPGIGISFTADRPFTTFKANAFTPELSDPQGWDTEVYPLTSTYTFGLKFEF